MILDDGAGIDIESCAFPLPIWLLRRSFRQWFCDSRSFKLPSGSLNVWYQLLGLLMQNLARNAATTARALSLRGELLLECRPHIVTRCNLGPRLEKSHTVTP